METLDFLKRITEFPFSLGPKGNNILLKVITELTEEAKDAVNGNNVSGAHIIVRA